MTKITCFVRIREKYIRLIVIFFFLNPLYAHRRGRIGQTEFILKGRVTLIVIGLLGSVPCSVRPHASISLSVLIFQHRLGGRNKFGYNWRPEGIITARDTIVVPSCKLRGGCKCTLYDVCTRTKTRNEVKDDGRNARGIRWRKRKPTRCKVTNCRLYTLLAKSEKRNC